MTPTRQVNGAKVRGRFVTLGTYALRRNIAQDWGHYKQWTRGPETRGPEDPGTRGPVEFGRQPHSSSLDYNIYGLSLSCFPWSGKNLVLLHRRRKVGAGGAQAPPITARKVPVSKSSQAWKLYDFKECTSWEMYKRAQGLKPCARYCAICTPRCTRFNPCARLYISQLVHSLKSYSFQACETLGYWHFSSCE